VEGILNRSIQGLEQDQTLRKIQDPEGAKQIEEFVKKFNDVKLSAFTMVNIFKIVFCSVEICFNYFLGIGRHQWKLFCRESIHSVK
jgi:hypothetical protein